MTYDVANDVQAISGSLFSETRTYNTMFQLTQISVPGALNISYAYSSTMNNGKIASQTDAISGEQVVYTYDALNRLATAETVTASGVTQWGQSYSYDGFGNLTAQNVIKGSAPTMSVTYNAATNRQTGDTADANGNLGSGYVYDIANRLLQASGTTMQYAYDSSNKRVWRGNGSTPDEIAFWGVNGQKLATYLVQGAFVYNFMLNTTDVYFGSRLIAKGTANSGNTNDYVTLATVATDRLGSIGKFYPYGIERPSATTNDTEKFTGYFRDAATGLDYAKNRYHQPGVGRFMTADPAASSAQTSDPGSWNRYTYTRGDPVNRKDGSGTDDCDLQDPSCGDDFTCAGDALTPCDNSAGCTWNSWACNTPDPGSLLQSWCNSSEASTFLPNPSVAAACGPYLTVQNTTAPPPQLTCSYTAFSGSAAPVAGTYINGQNQTIEGYGLPTSFTFSAQGGTGSYTWTETQSVTRYLKGPTSAIRLLYKGPDEPLYWSAGGSTTPPTTSSASVFDAPTTVSYPAGNTITWLFNLQVTVSSGGQTVNCPDVLWDAQISFNSSGGVSGSSWSVTQPSQ